MIYLIKLNFRYYIVFFQCAKTMMKKDLLEIRKDHFLELIYTNFVI